MDIIKEEPNLEEGRTQAPPMKEEQLVDIKYEEHSDPVSRKVILSPEMKFFDAIKLEPNSDTESDPILDIKHDELAFPVTSPAHLKSEEMEEVLGFEADGHEVMSEEHGCCNASHHNFTTHQYGGSTAEELLQQTVARVSEYEILGMCKKGSSWSRNQQTDLHVDCVKKSVTNSDSCRQCKILRYPLNFDDCKEFPDGNIYSEDYYSIVTESHYSNILLGVFIT
ncbi:hypothetical protein Cfor_12290 [Coptotermes formosanus]|uniref:Uncharacterized protein n=1 Tax=Coptotermes formosanus TaxID=36987 RepID=A0A6L2PQF3_COPFO|nr:hypothetical protein Cfor_12290 [Coptotermes formosanus]